MLCSRRVEHVVPAFGAGLGDTPENVIPVPCERLGRQRGEPCGHQTPFGTGSCHHLVSRKLGAELFVRLGQGRRDRSFGDSEHFADFGI